MSGVSGVVICHLAAARMPPNHVVGREIVKKLREMYPDAQILSMDYDPDVSFANLENRLQMLIMSIKEQQVQKDR